MSELNSFTPPEAEEQQGNKLGSKDELLAQLQEVDPSFYEYYRGKGGFDSWTPQVIKHNIDARREQKVVTERKRREFADKYLPMVNFTNQRDETRRSPLSEQEREAARQYLMNAYNSWPSAGEKWELPIYFTPTGGTPRVVSTVKVDLLTAEQIRQQYA